MGMACFDEPYIRRKVINTIRPEESIEPLENYKMEKNEIFENEKQIFEPMKNSNKIYFLDINSKYILIKIFSFFKKIKQLKIIKYNKKLQKRLEINKNDYRNYSNIKIEIIPQKCKYNNTFINILKSKERPYFHIYFNDNKKEVERNYIKKYEKIDKIKIIIEYNVESFAGLFHNCKNIKSIYFKKFYRNNINNMSNMFFGCSSLQELNLSNFNTDNVIYMNNMFYKCSSLEELNLSKFNTEKVINMSGMFNECSSLKYLNLSNFKTNNVIDMTEMFKECFSLEELDITNFNINNIKYINDIFYSCISLEKLKSSKDCLNKLNEMNIYFPKINIEEKD